jgi:hypothetical protein
MRIRTTFSVMTFRHAFFVSGVAQACPAGTYQIATDDELLESASFLAYRRVAATIRLPGGPRSVSRAIDVDPLGLDALVELDRRVKGRTHRLE